MERTASRSEAKNRLEKTLQPFTLTSAYLPGDLREWLEQFNHYYKKADMAEEII